MNLQLYRLFSKSDFTGGLLMIDGKPFCYTLEDEHRVQKLAGETRIPAGKYRVKLRKSLTPLTKRYRKRFPWFKYHIEIVGIPNFSYVYIHIGNNDDHTEACILTGYTSDITKPDGWVGKSTDAYKDFYEQIYPKLKNNEECWITIEDVG